MLRKKNLLLVITLVLLVFLVTGCIGLFPKPTKGIISGKVLIPPAGKGLSRDISGWVPAAGAEVTIVDASGVTHTVRTDANGYFSFENIAVKANTIITATVEIDGKTMILKTVIDKAIAKDQVYDSGTMTPESTALALVVEQLVVEGAPVDLDKIKVTDSYKNLLRKVTEVLEEYGNVAEDSNVGEAVGDTVEEIINPPVPPVPTPPSGGGGGGTPQPKFGSISGIVTNDVAGPPVEDSKIQVKKGDEVIAETTTDASGEYSIENIKTGIYDIIASKDGRASSKIQNVKIEANKTTTADIIHFQKNVPGWECIPPTITVTGIEDGGTYSSTISNIDINIQDESDIKYLFVGIDYIPNVLEYLKRADGKSKYLWNNFDTTLLSNGEHKVYFVAYDMNYNRSQLCITVRINNESSGGEPGIPANLWPMAITMGKNAGIFSREKEKPFISDITRIGHDPFNIPGKNKSIDLNAIINAAPPDSNIVVYITWYKADNATGYKVYRKFEGESDYKCIGTSLQDAHPYYLDSSPLLTVGKMVWYQVSAFNSYGESIRSDQRMVIPLAKFNVCLDSPADGATGVSLTPELTWSCSSRVGNGQFYRLYVKGKNDDYVTEKFGVWDNTSWHYWSSPLQPLKVYEWYFYHVFAYNFRYGDYPFYYYDSISIPGFVYHVNGENVYYDPITDAFEFTTGAE